MNAAAPPQGEKVPSGGQRSTRSDEPAGPQPHELFERVRLSFERQGLMRHLGATLLRVEPGRCELALPYSERVTQQQGGFHGGASGMLADIASDAAVFDLVSSEAILPAASLPQLEQCATPTKIVLPHHLHCV